MNARVGRILRGLVFSTLIGFAGVARAQNMLFNGGFEDPLTPALSIADNHGSSSDVPGWRLFSGGDDSSWALVEAETDPGAGGHDADLSGSDLTQPDFFGLAGLETAAGSRPTVVPGNSYAAFLTFDNYFEPVGLSYFIDWYDAGGVLISSSGGPLTDSDPFVFEPYTQAGSASGVAPANAATAGVRLQSSTDTFRGATADNFSLVPEPATTSMLLVVAAAGLTGRRRRR